ncbi:MAG: AAA family ATPase [Gemmatimonadales bacterium]|nr:AAA family ATPase [Gemmatimonadales bacterium]
MPIVRANHQEAVSRLLRRYPVVAILGARQVGKTTLARQLAAGWPGRVTTLDLEDPRDRAQLADPTLALGRCPPGGS